MTIDYDGAVAVITGGASGIGRSVALALAGRGADVVVADVHDERLAETESAIAALGRRALAVHCDVSSDDDVEHLRDETLRVMGRADIVMNNAGVALRGAFEEIPMADWEWIVGINLLGVVRGCRAFVPHLVERGSGYIVNTASIGGLGGAIISTPYVSTKHAVVGLSESLSLYLRPKGIGVSVLCPAGVATNILENLRKAGSDESMWGRPNEAAGRGGGGSAGMQTAEQVADLLLAAMDEDRFVVPTFPVMGAIGKRIEAIERMATPRPSPR